MNIKSHPCLVPILHSMFMHKQRVKIMKSLASNIAMNKIFVLITLIREKKLQPTLDLVNPVIMNIDYNQPK